MRKFTLHKYALTLAIVLGTVITSVAQNNFFNDAGENRVIPTSGNRVIVPAKYRVAGLDRLAMKNFLWALPQERSIVNNRNGAPVLSLPMPNGTVARFRVWESSIQEPGLEAKFPDIKTFAGQGIDDPYSTIRMDFGPNGFHAQVLTVNGSFYIDPYARGEVDNYITYFRTDLRKSGSFLCEVPDNPTNFRTESTQAVCLGTDLRTYRLAVACTGEYAQAPGISAGANPVTLHNAIVTTVNRVVGVYETEVSIRMILVANNNLVEFLNAATDPFNGNNNANVLINESQVVIDANIGSANYDIGHTFSTGGGGLATLNSPCNNSNKARGITGSPSPTGDGYDIDYVAHEIGHQFGGNHSMSGCGSSPTSTKYEVGSGTTIQAYAGICAAQNIQPNSDPYFHAISFDEISNFVVSGGGSGCGIVTPTGNTLPVIAALPNNNANIPPSTPFTLSASATDANGDALTYNWEQWDFNPGGGVSWNAGATGPVNNTYPLFKSRVPKTTGSRTFPDIAVILAGYPANPSGTMGGLKGETLSPVARAMKFKVTVRDNRAGGGGSVSSGSAGCQTNSTFTVNVVGTTPFTVSVPNGGESYPGGTPQTITWDAAGTSAAPYNVSNVRILLSTDGGLTYPTTISASTANDGSENLMIPVVPPTTTARVKVEAIGNIFFDISNADFTITAAPSGFTFNSPGPIVTSCPPPATMTATITATFLGVFSNPITLSASAPPAGTNVTFGTNPLTPGSPSSTVNLNNANILTPGNYTITVTGTATGATTQTRDIVFTVNPGTAPVITSAPSDRSICTGGSTNTSFSVVASGTVTGYQWQVSTDGGSNWNNVLNGGVYSGATTNTLSLTGATAAMNAYRYRVIVSGACATSVTSGSATLIVIAPVSILAAGQPADRMICSGSTATYTVTGNSTETISYQWQVSTDGGTTWTNVSNGGVYSGANTTTLTVTGAPVSMNGYRYRALLNNITCTSPTVSATALITVRQLPTVGLTASPLTSLLPGQTTTLTATPSAPAAGGTQTITWLYNGVPAVPAITGNSYVVNVEQIGTYQVLIQEAYTSPTLVCSNQSPVVTITAAASSRLFIFPTPNDGRFTVSYFNNGGASTDRNIVIFDSKGSQVYNRKFPVVGLYTLINIDLRQVGRGIYYVVVGDATGKKLAEGKVHIR